MTVPVALGVRAIKGGGALIAVAADDGEPRVMLSTFVATAVEGDRLSLEPYGVAAEMVQRPYASSLDEAAAVVAEGRKRQDQMALKGLDDIVLKLNDIGCKPVVAALLVNRAGWITDALSYSLSWPEHVPVAEGLAVRDAFRFALNRRIDDVAEMDEKSLPDLASALLGLGSAEIDARLKALGVSVGKPWRKEQKLACLAAWLAVARAPA